MLPRAARDAALARALKVHEKAARAGALLGGDLAALSTARFGQEVLKRLAQLEQPVGDGIGCGPYGDLED